MTKRKKGLLDKFKKSLAKAEASGVGGRPGRLAARWPQAVPGSRGTFRRLGDRRRGPYREWFR